MSLKFTDLIFESHDPSIYMNLDIHVPVCKIKKGYIHHNHAIIFYTFRLTKLYFIK